jgi:hypothetical protein
MLAGLTDIQFVSAEAQPHQATLGRVKPPFEELQSFP